MKRTWLFLANDDELNSRVFCNKNTLRGRKAYFVERKNPYPRPSSRSHRNRPYVGFILSAAKLEEGRRRRHTCHDEEIKKWDHRNGMNAQVGRTSRRNAEDTRQKGASRRGLKSGRIKGTTVREKHRVWMEEEDLGKETTGRKLRGGSVR